MNMKNTIFRNQRKALTSSKKRPQRGFNWVDFEDQNQRQRTESKSSSNFDSNIYCKKQKILTVKFSHKQRTCGKTHGLHRSET